LPWFRSVRVQSVNETPEEAETAAKCKLITDPAEEELTAVLKQESETLKGEMQDTDYALTFSMMSVRFQCPESEFVVVPICVFDGEDGTLWVRV
jgi:hypothetical protein